MTRRWFSLLFSSADLLLPAIEPAQVDFATGGQRDDDRDGYRNPCGADFTMSGAEVGGRDLGQRRASVGRSRAATTCGTTGNLRCAVFDLDETGSSIDADDLKRFRELSGRQAGLTRPSGPLACESADPGNCD